MKDLSKLEVVKQALTKVVVESDVDNGTRDIEIMCHYWQTENVFDKRRQNIQLEITRALLASDLEKVKEYQSELATLPKPKIIMEFKLMTPIPRLVGTRTVTDGEKISKIVMENVKTIFIPEDAVNLGLLEYEETNEVAKDSMGRDTAIIKLHLKKGIIDVASPKVDRDEKIIVPKRAYVTPISYGAMQVAGRLLYNETLRKKKRIGFDDSEQ